MGIGCDRVKLVAKQMASILAENEATVADAGRMGANVPEWLSRYIAVLKKKIDDKGSENDDSKND